MRLVGMRTIIAASFIWSGALSTMLLGQPFSVARKITASDATTSDQFGRSVGISGNKTIVGAWQFLYEGSGKPGAAYVFDVATGHQRLKLTASDATPNDAFGMAVGIDGNVGVVGAPLKSDHGYRSGAAYVFDLVTGNELFKLTADDAVTQAHFGTSIAISQATAIVGAPHNPYESTWETDAAYLFDVTTGAQLFKLTSTDGTRGDDFGQAVAIYGNKAIVGAHGHEDGQGAAYVFDVTTGHQLTKLMAAEPNSWPPIHFGIAVAINDNIALVGSPHLNKVHAFDANTGIELFTLTGSDSSSYHYFGCDVAIDGNMAIIGASGFNNDAGAVYIFDLLTRQELARLTPTHPGETDRFGEFVDIDGNSAIGSVRLSDESGVSSGSAYIFTPEPSTFVLSVLGCVLLGCHSRRAKGVGGMLSR